MAVCSAIMRHLGVPPPATPSSAELAGHRFIQQGGNAALVYRFKNKERLRALFSKLEFAQFAQGLSASSLQQSASVGLLVATPCPWGPVPVRAQDKEPGKIQGAK